MKLSAYIHKDCSKTAVLFHSKKRVFEYLANLAHQQLPHVEEQTLLRALLEREKLGSTGIGQGIAIPHGRIAGIDAVVAIVLVNGCGVAVDAIDKQPADIFVALFVPEDDANQHLKTLATFAEKLKNKQFCKQLRSAQTDDELYHILTEAA